MPILAASQSRAFAAFQVAMARTRPGTGAWESAEEQQGRNQNSLALHRLPLIKSDQRSSLSSSCGFYLELFCHLVRCQRDGGFVHILIAML
jgi:hypothetical protein